MALNHLLRLQTLILLLTGAMIAAGTLGCVPAAPQIKDETPRQVSKVSIGELKNAPAKWQNMEVAISGKYRGWEYSCPASGQRTRSDWVIQDDTGCIFVSGIIPSNLSPTQPGGQLLSVVGTLRLSPAGLPYFEGSRVKIMPVLPSR